MDFALLIKAIVLGIVVSAPVGPVAAMAMSRSLVYGKKLGFITGFGIALADALFALIAGLGVAQIIDFITQYREKIAIFGGLILVIMGTHLWAKAKKIALQKKLRRVKPSVAMMSSFVIGMSNPLAIFTFLAAVSDPRMGKIDSLLQVSCLTLGVLLGACLWWLALVFGVSYFRDRIQGKTLMWINRILGLFIVTIGAIMIALKGA